MTVKEFIYDYFFPEGYSKSKQKDFLFKLCKRGTDISKKENVKILHRGSFGQPIFLYEKKVVKFWIETCSRTNELFIWVLYEDRDKIC